MAQDLKNFVNRIFGVNPSYSSVLGSGIPGMAGTSIASIGASSSSSAVVSDLRKTTALFAEKVSKQAPRNEITSLAKTIEADLLTLRSLEQISEDLCNSLIDELHALIKK